MKVWIVTEDEDCGEGQSPSFVAACATGLDALGVIDDLVAAMPVRYEHRLEINLEQCSVTRYAQVPTGRYVSGRWVDDGAVRDAWRNTWYVREVEVVGTSTDPADTRD